MTEENKRIWFVCAKMSADDLVCGEPFTGAAGRWLFLKCLKPLGVGRSDVGLWSLEKGAVPTLKGDLIVAVGTPAREALGSLASVSIPHPNAVLKRYDSGETDRKVAQIKSLFDDLTKSGETDSVSDKGVSPDLPRDSDQSPTTAEPTSKSKPVKSTEVREVKIAKAHVEKQIVYGVVLDPYIVDAHGDWTPPAEVEKLAHAFLSDPTPGYMHEGVDVGSQVVESWVVDYPTPEDYQKAMRNEPHSVYAKRFGDETIHSGTWMLGTRLNDTSWAEYKTGELNAFSPGGSGSREKIDRSAMPEVEVIDAN